MQQLAHWALGLAGAGLLLQAPALPAFGFDGSGLYQPHAAWVGRLILPTDPAWPGSSPPPGDWVWIELQQTPPAHRDLVGRRLPLTWQSTPQIERMVRLVTTDVRFTPEARQAAAGGWILPERLDGRKAVGPLMSLAGARPEDDLQVSLEQVQVDPSGAVLRLGRPPIQISGRYKALVQVLGPDAEAGPDRYRVRHFNRQTLGFDGRRDSVRIPEGPLHASGLRRHFSAKGLVGSSAGRDGWYLFGEPDGEGVFTVDAIQPRALVRLQPDRRIIGAEAGFAFVHEQQWDHVSRHPGRLSRTWIQAAGDATAAPIPPWNVGDEALVLHLWGGMGGTNGELQDYDDLIGPGHFSFGLARVVRDSLSEEPILSLRYYQIYTHNTEGIVSSSVDWSAYMGNLRRGWLNLRTVSDVLVWFDPLSSSVAPDTELARSPLAELGLQSEVMMARYRSGDGTGYTKVGLSQSCVQDSAQALYITLGRLRKAARQQQEGATGLHHETLSALAAGVFPLVAPTGEVRSDWAHNAAVLTDWPPLEPSSGASPFHRGALTDALLSRRTILPRRAQEDLARLLLQLGSDLWVLRTTQIPAAPPGVVPLAPSLLEP